MHIEYSKKAAKYISVLVNPTKQRIKAGIEGLATKPPRGDIKILHIMNVDTRGDIYK